MHSVENYAQLEDVLAEIRRRVRSRRRAKLLPVGEAFGRIAAEDILAPDDVPRLPTSHMDGFAVLASDLGSASAEDPVVLTITGRGNLVGRPGTVRHGEAVRIATGGELPEGADTVLPVETVEEEGGHLMVRNRPESGSFVYQVGQDFKRGETVLAAGRPIRAQDVGMLIMLGFTKLRVQEKPRVSVVATGSELTGSSRPARGRVRNSHSPVFLRLCEAHGCVGVDGGIVPDDYGKMASAIRRSLAESDLVITLGGTSLGRHDLTGKVVEDMNPEAAFHGIKMDRGRVTGVALVKGKPVLMLPGPIQGAMNAFFLLGVPIIRLLSGRSEPDLEMQCRMGEGWEARRRFANYRKVLYVTLRRGPEVVAEPILGETESVRVLTEADGYVSVPEEVTQIAKGAKVAVKLISGFSFA